MSLSIGGGGVGRGGHPDPKIKGEPGLQTKLAQNIRVTKSEI